MPITIVPLGLTNASRIIRDSDADNTTEVDVNDGPAVVYAVEFDNTATGNTIAYLKLYNIATVGGVTAGTTAPDAIIPMPAGTRRTWVFPNPLRFATGLSHRAVQEAGTAGTTNPGADVRASIYVR